MEKIFEKTYKKKRDTLLQYIQSRVNNLQDAEDILQDVFYQAVRNQNMAQPINNLIGWLFRITQNKIIDWYRKKKHKTVSLQEQIKDDIILEDLISNSRIDVEKDFIRSQLSEAIYKCINQLPEKQRNVFIKRELKGMSYKEISAETGITINTLLARKRYANLFLQKRLAAINESIKQL